MPNTLTPEEIQTMIATAPSAADGLSQALAVSGINLRADVAERLVEAIQARGDGEPYVTSIRDILKGWRATPRGGQDVVVWELTTRALRLLLRQNKVFAAHPIISIHQINPVADRGDETLSPALTGEQLAELPDETWIEIRITVPTRTLPGAAAPALEPQ